MADVMEAFLRGHQFGQAEREHEQQLEENKIRTLVLKHQIDAIKIEDQIRTRELAKQNLDLMHGQPAADLPSTNVTTQQPNLPSESVAGAMTGLPGLLSGMRAGQSRLLGPEEPAAEATTLRAPAAQVPGTNPVTTRVPNAIDIPGVPGLNVPGVSIRPRSMEDLIRSQIATELAKPYTLNEGDTRMLGGDVIGRGGPKLQSVGAGGLANSKGDIVVPGPGRANRRSSVSGTLNGKDAFAVFDPDTEKYTINGADVTGTFQPRPVRGPDPQAAADRRDQGQWNRDFRQYTEEVAQGQRAHAEAVKKYLFAASTANNGVDTMTGKPIGDAPEYTPPTFEEWRAAHPPAAAEKGAGETKAASAASGQPPAGKEGQVLPIPGKPGQEMTFKKNAAGKLVWIRTK